MSLNATLPEAVELLSQARPVKTARPRSIKYIKVPIVGPTESSLIWSILTTSAALHLLFIGFLGSSVPKAAPARLKSTVPPPSAVELVEDIKVEPEPELLPPPPIKNEELPLDSEPPTSANIDLPALSQVEPIAAVSATVPVAFGIGVTGPVRLVADASQASGRIGGRRGPVPISLDDDAQQEKNLLIPAIVYPAVAQVRRQSGTVLVEFRTSPTGDILDVKVRESSGFTPLDNAALENLRHGRWVGAAGYYLKAYLFRLN